MIFAAEMAKEQSCYIRFFNGACGLDDADIFVGGEVVAQNLAHGAFSEFRKAQPGAYNVEVCIGGNEVEYSELFSFMEDMAYTIVLVGNPEHIDMAIISLDLRQDFKRPNLRFANMMPHDTVIDINIDRHKAVQGLAYKEVSYHIEIMPGNYVVTVFDDESRKILEDGITIAADHSYLAIAAGSVAEPENPPGLYIAEEMPFL